MIPEKLLFRKNFEFSWMTVLRQTSQKRIFSPEILIIGENMPYAVVGQHDGEDDEWSDEDVSGLLKKEVVFF